MKSNDNTDDSDDICKMCGCRGSLLLCDGDGCVSAFHLNCLQLKDTPVGKWFCPTCQNTRGTSPVGNESNNEGTYYFFPLYATST